MQIVTILLVLTRCRSGGVIGEVLDSFPHLATVMCISVDVMISIILSTSLVPTSMVVSNGLVEYCFLYAS